MQNPDIYKLLAETDATNPQTAKSSNNWIIPAIFWIVMVILVLITLAFMQFVLRLPVDTYLIRFWHIITFNFDN